MEEIESILKVDYPEVECVISEGFVFIFYKDNKKLNAKDTNMLSYKEAGEYLVWLKNGNTGTFNEKDKEEADEKETNNPRT